MFLNDGSNVDDKEEFNVYEESFQEKQV